MMRCCDGLVVKYGPDTAAPMVGVDVEALQPHTLVLWLEHHSPNDLTTTDLCHQNNDFVSIQERAPSGFECCRRRWRSWREDRLIPDGDCPGMQRDDRAHVIEMCLANDYAETFAG